MYSGKREGKKRYLCMPFFSPLNINHSNNNNDTLPLGASAGGGGETLLWKRERGGGVVFKHYQILQCTLPRGS